MMKLGLGRKVRHFTLATTAVQCLMSGTIVYGQGQDSQAHDFVPAPAGTQIGLLYYLGSTSDTYIDGHGHKVDDSSLDTNVGLLRYVYYFDIAGMRADVNVLQPFGSLNNMRVGGSDIDTKDFSIGDVTLVGTLWPLNDPEHERYFAIATYLTLPTGNYSASEPGLGSNRWSLSIQPGYLFKIAPQWSVDLVGDVTFYGDNNDGPGGADLEKDPSFTMLGWLNYEASAKTMFSLGFTTTRGGEESVKGVDGSDVKSTTIRAEWSQMLSPTTQFLMEIGHDVDAENTFKRDATLTFRLAKFF
ncbi:transporter [Pseudomonas veronii]|uniref:transporter n=1 Tax=Pseudomonas veronii TaxID=76761 RepID=UPI000704AC76|nr:transporter [Pseudomonas veronii]MCT9828210.1 transporter [Pseudomonas veronii]SEC16292.1 Putative MetA-pathway of phenol degradation [Pseudomonas marginalis]